MKKFILLLFLVQVILISSQNSEQDKSNKELISNIKKTAEDIHSKMGNAKSELENIDKEIEKIQKEFESLNPEQKTEAKIEEFSAKMIALNIAKNIGAVLLDVCDESAQKMAETAKIINKNNINK